MGPAPLRSLPEETCRDLAWLFTDIDDTLTTDGILPPDSYQALWDISRAGIEVVPVTGRPAGWCDHIARMWPVAAVIGENGAFYYSYHRARRRMQRRTLGKGPAGRPLSEVAARVLREVPGSAIAADQPFRVNDYAIDYCEDVPPLGPDALDRICAILSEERVSYRVSSIHVNFWRGTFDKMSGVRAWLADAAEDPPAALRRAVFIGDSPNDEPLFEAFPTSIAVGNLRRYLRLIKRLPSFITEAESAAGFCEACRTILAKRRA